MANLKDMPVRRWQCSDGCKHLKERPGREGRYDCTFWDTVPKTLSANPVPWKPCGIISGKRIKGPFTDEPTLECPHFSREG